MRKQFIKDKVKKSFVKDKEKIIPNQKNIKSELRKQKLQAEEK